MKYSSEKLFLDDVERCLKNNGCLTWREVVPDQCIGLSRPYRVDLIFYRKDIGYIAAEAKNANSLRCGGKFAKAIIQMQSKYISKTYFGGTKINKWCVCFPTKSVWDNLCYSQDEAKRIKTEVLNFLRNFLKTYCNISMLNFFPGNKWSSPEVRIDAYKKDVIKIGGYQ